MTDEPSLLEDLRREVSAMPPGALLPRDWLLSRLSDRPAAAGGEPGGVAVVDLSIADLARVFGKRPSTVRGWVERGQFPGAYKLHGKEWRVPRSAVAAFQDMQRAKPARATKARSPLAEWRTVRRANPDRQTRSGHSAVTERPVGGNAED